MIGQDVMILRKKDGLDYINGRRFLQCGWQNTGTGCLESSECLISLNIPSEIGWCNEQPDLIEDVLAHCEDVG